MRAGGLERPERVFGGGFVRIEEGWRVCFRVRWIGEEGDERAG